MSGTRPPNKNDSAEDSSSATPNSPDQNEERQKKIKADQQPPQSTQSTSSFSGMTSPTANPQLSSPSSSSNPPPARTSSFPFVPRPVMSAKRKSDSALPTSTPASSAVTVSLSSNLISSLLARAEPTAPSAPVAISSLDEKPIPKAPGYLILESQFAQVGDIAKLIAPLGEKQNKR